MIVTHTRDSRWLSDKPLANHKEIWSSIQTQQSLWGSVPVPPPCWNVSESPLSWPWVAVVGVRLTTSFTYLLLHRSFLWLLAFCFFIVCLLLVCFPFFASLRTSIALVELWPIQTHSNAPYSFLINSAMPYSDWSTLQYLTLTEILCNALLWLKYSAKPYSDWCAILWPKYSSMPDSDCTCNTLLWLKCYAMPHSDWSTLQCPTLTEVLCNASLWLKYSAMPYSDWSTMQWFTLKYSAMPYSELSSLQCLILWPKYFAILTMTEVLCNASLWLKYSAILHSEVLCHTVT